MAGLLDAPTRLLGPATVARVARGALRRPAPGPQPDVAEHEDPVDDPAPPV